jgi:hypothetical protein
LFTQEIYAKEETFGTSSSSTLEEDHEAQQESRHAMNMTPNDPRTEASMCKSLGTQPENNKAWMASIQVLTTKETTSKAHMQVHTNGESREKQSGQKPRPNWAETSPSRSAQAGRPSPFWAQFGAPFDVATIRTIYSPLTKSHGGIHSSSAAKEQRREGHHSGEERRGSRWLTRVSLADVGTLHGRPCRSS